MFDQKGIVDKDRGSFVRSDRCDCFSVAIGCGARLAVRVVNEVEGIVGFRQRPQFAVHQRSRDAADIRGAFGAQHGWNGFDTTTGRILLELRNDFIDPSPANNLHHVVVKAVLLAHAQNRHDVCVVQLGRRLCLAAKTPQLFVVEERLLGQHLHRDSTPKRLLFRFVNDPHPTATDLLNDAQVTQPFDLGRAK